jgi:type I restriction enzyme S subunit
MSWRTISVGDLVDAGAADIQTGPFGTQLKASDYVDDGTPVINVRNIGFASLRPEKLEFVTEETAERLATHLLEPHDIVFGRKGAVDRHLYVGDDQDHWMQGSDCIRLRFIGADVVPRFVSYAFLTETHQKWMLAQAGNKATMASLNHDIIRRIALRLPIPAVQEATVAILSAYDDLIENNRRRMALLEQAARQLFREWFVRLRFPGHEHTHMTDGVPQGWEKRTFADACASLEDGDWIESKDQGGEDYRLLQISNIGINEFVETGKFRYVTTETFKRLNCRELVPGNVLIARMPTPIGRAWLVTEMPWRMITAVDAAIAVANEELADPYFLTYYLNSPASLEHCERRAVGATRPRIARRELAALPLVLPSRRLQTHFREWVEPMNLQRTTLYRQNEKLRAARELLLPRLMSGELAV